MAEIALEREFFGKFGFVKVKFIKKRDGKTGKDIIKVKGRKGPYRFKGDKFEDLYQAQRFVADRIAEIDKENDV